MSDVYWQVIEDEYGLWAAKIVRHMLLHYSPREAVKKAENAFALAESYESDPWGGYAAVCAEYEACLYLAVGMFLMN